MLPYLVIATVWVFITAWFSNRARRPALFLPAAPFFLLIIVFSVAVSLPQQRHVSKALVLVATAFADTRDFMTPAWYDHTPVVYDTGNSSIANGFRMAIPSAIFYSTVCLLFITWYYNL